MNHECDDFSTLNILDFPEEITLYIFSYLSAADLSSNVAKVCTLWKDYARSSCLWKHLDFTVEDGRCRREQVSVFQTASAFRQLTLKDCESLESLLPLLFSNCSSIKGLVISGEEINSDVLASLAYYFKGSIRSLALEGMELNNSWYSAMSCIAKGLNSLTLKADCCVWAMGLLSVECASLTSLRLTSCCQSEDHRRQVQGVKRMLQLLPDGLTVLQLGAQISPNLDILQAIGEKRRLQSLTLEDCCEIWDGDLLYLLNLRHIQCLQLWRSHRLTSSGLLCFIHGSRFDHLKHLDLFDCPNLDDTVLQEISIKCCLLDTLDVSSCHLLTDHGIGSIFQFCSQLHTLKMSHLPQPTGFGYLNKLAELLPKLIYLDVYNCSNIPYHVLESLETKKLIVMFRKQGRRY